MKTFKLLLDKKYLTFSDACIIRDFFLDLDYPLTGEGIVAKLDEMGLETTYDVSRCTHGTYFAYNFLYQYAFCNLNQEKSHLVLKDEYKLFLARIKYGF